MVDTTSLPQDMPPREAAVIKVAAVRAAETERLRHLHPEVVDALLDSGIFRRWVAAEMGGESASVTQVLGSIERVSRADGSAGWAVMIANTTALTSHRLPARWAHEIYSDPRGCTGGYGMPAGTARVVDGGLEVTGRWSWGSGTDHCTWIGGGVRVVDDDGNPAATSDGATTPFVFFEPGQVELLDTWHVAGLRGTASGDYSVERGFVPEGRWVQLVGSEQRTEGPLGSFPFFGALAAGVAAVLIGLAEHAIDEFVSLAGKRSAGSRRTLAERGAAQADLALARANVAQSRAHLHQTTDRLWQASRDGAEVSGPDRADLRLAATAAARRCTEAVDLCYHAAGGAAVYESNPIQRVFRDAHVAITHGMIAPRTLEPLGRMTFGLPTDTTLF